MYLQDTVTTCSSKYSTSGCEVKISRLNRSDKPRTKLISLINKPTRHDWFWMLCKEVPRFLFFNAPKANCIGRNLAVGRANCDTTILKLVCAEHFRPEDNKYIDRFTETLPMNLETDLKLV